MFELSLFVAGYLLGSFPTGVVLSRRKYGIDVREMGSGNIGATNITRVFGWYAGVLTFLIDFLKGALPLLYVHWHFPGNEWAKAALGCALVLGHCFSLYLGFRGGKGVATSLGVLAVVVPPLAIGAAVVYGVLLIVTRISAVGSLGGMAVAILYLAIWQPEKPVTLLVSAICVLVAARHQSNIRRLWQDFKKKTGRAK